MMHRIVRTCLTSLILALLLAGCAGTPGVEPGGVRTGRFAPPAGTPADSLVLVSYNIAFGRNVEQAAAQLRADTLLAKLDVLLVQEMDPAAMDQLARELQLDYVYRPGYVHPRHDRPWGNGILSRWPIVGHDSVELPHPRYFTDKHRRAVAADIQLGERRLRVVSVHLSTPVQPLDRRLHQAEVLADSLASVPWPVIVAGDFNTSTDFEIRELRQALRPWRLRQVRLPAGATAEGKAMYGLVAGDLVLDHLFYRGLRPGASGIARHITASDHYPVWTVFTWRD